MCGNDLSRLRLDNMTSDKYLRIYLYISEGRCHYYFYLFNVNEKMAPKLLSGVTNLQNTYCV